MENHKHPTLANGKVCYIEVPAVDVRRSAEFYEKVFGWRIRQRSDGSIAFDDAVGEVSGTWVLGRPAATSPGLLIYIMVDSVSATIDAVIANGGELVQPIGADAPEITARFRDPAGNVMGLYQEPSRPAPGIKILNKNESTEPQSKQEFVITRVFNAPRELVFKAWTEPERLKHWWGPKGFTCRVAKLDFRRGGIFHYCLRAPNGSNMWGKFVYREIIVPERIVCINSFSDEEGNVTRHPLSPTWPLEMLSTVTFSEQEGRTTLIVQWVPHSATESELKTFEATHEGMQQGWTGTLDQLTDYLAKA